MNYLKESVTIGFCQSTENKNVSPVSKHIVQSPQALDRNTVSQFERKALLPALFKYFSDESRSETQINPLRMKKPKRDTSTSAERP